MTGPRDERPAAVDDDARADPAVGASDVEVIARLTDEIVPALAAKLAATGLGELEVRQGAWKVRVRRPDGDAGRPARRASDRPSRAQPGHAGHGHAPGAVEGHRGGRPAAAYSGNGSQPPELTPVGPGPTGGRDARERDPHRDVATSPAVGVFQPAASAQAGTRVRAGDRLGVVDMLGVPQEIVAPADGIVGATLVEAGDAVEYGQELIVVELAERADHAG
ncbi:MAG TPA: biotin/lipoyl-containing protein [Candidatus Limnocylindrales bacterium]